MKKDSYTPEEIQGRFDSLPSDIKSLVYGADMLNLIQRVGEKYKLHIDKVGILEAETADVMTGFSKPEEFVKNLMDSLSIEKAQADNIAKDINDGLFVKIRESMKKLSSQEPTATKLVEPHRADLMLTQKTVTIAPTPTTKPPPYKADPYREPTN